jgi:hypothetical protein
VFDWARKWKWEFQILFHRIYVVRREYIRVGLENII